ncbi:MAG: carboxymuconolactone decarboxylase family protein [Phycisphaerae bacterium]|nr:carboxymuconolactone decarboxylase family protein [Phycisphaerae bacterium]
MSRLQAVDPSRCTGRAKEIFEGPLKGKAFNIFKSMGNSAAALDGYLGLSGALNGAGLSAAERETVQLAIGEANNCGYCVAAHTAIGTGAGLSEAQTVEARRGHLKDARLNAVARFALAIHEKKGFVSDEDVRAFRAAGYTDGHVAEVVACYALAVFTNYFNHVNGTAVDFPAPPAI